jgi:hypothetical protein
MPSSRRGGAPARPLALGHGGAGRARPDPLRSSLAPVRLARPGAACSPAAPGSSGAACPPAAPARPCARPWRLARPRSAPASPALGAPPFLLASAGQPRPCARHGAAARPVRPWLARPWSGPGPARGMAQRRSSPAPGSAVAARARPRRPAPPVRLPCRLARAAPRPPAAWHGLAPALLAVAAWLARPRLGAALRPPCMPWRRGSPARDRGPARPTPDVLRSPARRGLLAWLDRDVAAWRAPWRPSSLAAALATCSWRPRSLARVCGSGPRRRSLARVAYSPVQRLTITLSHLSFRCELSRYDALRQLKVLVLMGLCQEAAITRHGLIMLR